jgi:Fic family protein
MMFQPRYTVTPHMLRCLTAIERTVGFLEAIRLGDGQQLIRLQKECRVHEALNSVQIEGSSLTLDEAFALADKLPHESLSNRDREFVNYLRAFEALDEFRGQRGLALTAGDLREIQRLLVGGVRGGDRDAGAFRGGPVKVADVSAEGTVVHHEPPEPMDVPVLVQELLDWIEATKVHGKKGDPGDAWVHPAIQAGIAHHRLVWIHPFTDGNGRSTRMFTTLLLYQRGYDFKYLFELSSYYNFGDRSAYYNALRSADRSGDYTRWLDYFLGGLSMQMFQIRARAGQVLGEASG